MLGLQHLRGRSASEKEGDDIRKAKFNFSTTEEVKTSESAREAEHVWTDGGRTVNQRQDICRGSNRKRELKPELTEPRGGRAVEGGSGGRVEKGRADQEKAKTKTWSDVVKGLKIKELDTPNADKCRNES